MIGSTALLDFKRLFDRVWHARLWQILRIFNIEDGLVQATQALQCSPLEQSARGVLQDNSRHPSGMLALTHPVQLVPGEDHAGNTLYHHASISIDGKPICNLQFANDINFVGASNQDLTSRLMDRATACGMEVITEE